MDRAGRLICINQCQLGLVNSSIEASDMFLLSNISILRLIICQIADFLKWK